MQDENEIKGFRSLADIFVDTDYAHKHYLSHLWLISAYRTMSPEKQRMLQVYADMLLHYDREM